MQKSRSTSKDSQAREALLAFLQWEARVEKVQAVLDLTLETACNKANLFLGGQGGAGGIAGKAGPGGPGGFGREGIKHFRGRQRDVEKYDCGNVIHGCDGGDATYYEDYGRNGVEGQCCQGPTGSSGQAGIAGENGVNGKAGTPGREGRPGQKGQDGTN